MKTITFKTKVKKIWNDDKTAVDYVDLQKTVTRAHCNIRPHEHRYYNSDMFPAILNGAYKAITKGKEWMRLSDLPPEITVDTSKFLAVVTIRLPDSFQ